MPAKALISFVFAVSLIGITGCATNQNNKVANLPEKEIRDLSYAIKAAPSYREDLRALLDRMQDTLQKATTDVERCTSLLSLSWKFRPINTDSALHYAYRAQGVAQSLDTDFRQKASIAVINSLATAGLFTDATELYENLGKETMSDQTRLEYWGAGRRLYGYMASYTQGNQECYTKYDGLYHEYDHLLIEHLPPNSDFLIFIECEHLIEEKRYQEAQARLGKLIEKLPQESNLYGMATYQMAQVWHHLGDEKRYAAMLALSALSDVKGCVTEGWALPTLADWLYRNGELGEAYSFINFALEEASTGNARMRAVTIAQFVPVIDEAYRDKVNSSRDELMVYFILAAFLLVASVLLLVFLIKQVKKSRANEKKLSYTSRRQESYIGNFIGLYSSYADRLNHLAKLVSTKLAAGQSAELKKLIDAGKFTDQNNDDIHKIFDAAFLDIYPQFVEDINSLLKPEEAIQVKSNDILTPELRIYAFVKLGVEESSRIAQILHYSIHTVYTYRNKMRNKALHRDTFDQDVKAL